MNTNHQQQLHWLTVGCISDAARVEIERTGGQVKQLYHDPATSLVGIAYDASAHPDDLAFNHGSEIQIDVRSTGLSLVWVSSERITNAAYSSLTNTSLITYAEYVVMLNGGDNTSVNEDTLPDIDLDDVTF